MKQLAKIISPLAWNVPIVDPKTGYPTEYFKRILEDISDARISASLVEALGGDPDEDQVVTWDDVAGDLAFKPASDVLDMIGSEAHGDILYRDADAWSLLSAGSDGDVLTTHGAGADPTWETPSGGGGSFKGALVYKSADQTGANYSVFSPVSWNTETYDTDSFHGKSSTVTITIASPGVITWTGHGLIDGTPIILSTTGALPTGLTAGTTYFIVSSTTDTFSLSATAGGAAINTSGTQSGVHTATVRDTVFVVPNGVSKIRLGSQMGCLLVATNAILILSIVKNGDTTVFSTFSGVTVSTRDSIANADPSLQTWTPVIPVSPGDFFETYFLNTDASITVQANRSWFSIEVIE